MQKLFFLTSFVIVIIFFSVASLHAQLNFTTDVKTEYKVEENGITRVTNTFSVKNITSKYQATSYILNLTSINPTNVKAFEKGEQLSVVQSQEGQKTTLEVNFINKVSGIGKTRTFIVTYDEENIANKSGEIWEITVPKLNKQNSFTSYNTYLSIPDSFGDEAYISPQPKEVRKENSRKVYIYDKTLLEERGITGGFGKSQIFSFTLSYHLENTTNKDSLTDIAVPPDTSLQKIYYQKIEPEPKIIKPDSDGNWIATFLLKPKQRIDVNVVGTAQIFASPRRMVKPSEDILKENIKPSEFWQSEDPQIIEIAQNLKNPRAIYDFVVSYLSYDTSRVKPNITRLGAKTALASPDNAICMEFTDLFIAIARAAGIPAREINGYAHTENPDIKPLSLVADVLHAWPEYWDELRQTWVSVDPTWGNTSGGDYFEKLDLRHITFVIHGKDPSYPYPPGSYKLGSNPQKDVFVTFGTLPANRLTDVDIDYRLSYGLGKRNLSVVFKNKGSFAEYDLPAQVLFDENMIINESIPILVPYGEYKLMTQIPYGIFATDSPDKTLIKTAGYIELVDMQKLQTIIFQTIIIFFITIGIILTVLIHAHKLKISDIKSYLKKPFKYANKYRKNTF